MDPGPSRIWLLGTALALLGGLFSVGSWPSASAAGTKGFTPEGRHLSVEGLAFFGGAPKKQRRRRAEKRLSKGSFWRVRFYSAPLRFSEPYRCF